MSLMILTHTSALLWRRVCLSALLARSTVTTPSTRVKGFSNVFIQNKLRKRVASGLNLRQSDLRNPLEFLKALVVVLGSEERKKIKRIPKDRRTGELMQNWLRYHNAGIQNPKAKNWCKHLYTNINGTMLNHTVRQRRNTSRQTSEKQNPKTTIMLNLNHDDIGTWPQSHLFLLVV